MPPTDAGHMFTDVVGLGMALAAIQVATAAAAHRQRTFGLYRLEILAALANAVLLFGVAIWIIWEAVQCVSDPPEVLGTPMLVVAVIGLLVTLVALWLLREGADKSLNVEGACLEVLADTLGSVGVVIAAVVIQLTGFARIDAIFGVGIGMFVLPRTWRLGRKALRVLTQTAPDHIDVDEVRDAPDGYRGGRRHPRPPRLDIDVGDGRHFSPRRPRVRRGRPRRTGSCTWPAPCPARSRTRDHPGRTGRSRGLRGLHPAGPVTAASPRE